MEECVRKILEDKSTGVSTIVEIWSLPKGHELESSLMILEDSDLEESLERIVDSYKRHRADRDKIINDAN